MRTTNEQLMDKLMKTFENYGLSAKQMNEIEDYLRGGTNSISLGLKEKCSLYDAAHKDNNQVVHQTLSQLLKMKEEETYLRYYHAMFEVFGPGIGAFILTYQNPMVEKLPADQVIAMKAYMGASRSRVKNYWRADDDMKSIAKKGYQEEEILGAMKYLSPKNVNARVILYAALFWVGGGEEPVERHDFKKQEGLLSKLFGHGDSDSLSGALSRKKKYSKEFDYLTETIIQSIGVLFSGGANIAGAGNRSASGLANVSMIGAASGNTGSQTAGNTGGSSAADTDSYGIVDNEYVSTVQMTEDERKQVVDYIKGDKYADQEVPPSIRQIVRKYLYNAATANLLIAAAGACYRLSPKLTSFLKVCCVSSNPANALEIMSVAGWKDKMTDEYIRWMLDLSPDMGATLKWAAGHNHNSLLVYLACNHPDEYKAVMQDVNFQSYCNMAYVIEHMLPKDSYEKDYQGYVASQTEAARTAVKHQLMARVLANHALAKDGTDLVALASEVLDGAKDFRTLEPYRKEYEQSTYSDHSSTIMYYRNTYGADDFYKRCLGYLGFSSSIYTFRNLVIKHGAGKKPQLPMQELFEELKYSGLTLTEQYDLADQVYEEAWGDKTEIYEDIKHIFLRYLGTDEAETLKAFKGAGASGRRLAVLILFINADRYKSEILSYTEDSSKVVREEVVDELAKREDWAEDVLTILETSKKADARLTTAMVVAKYQQDYRERLTAIYGKEKSKKVLDVISAVLNRGAGGAAGASGSGAVGMAGQDGTAGAANGMSAGGRIVNGASGAAGGMVVSMSVEDYIKLMHKGGKKRSITWVYETALPAVHFAGSGTDGATDETKPETEASEEYMQAVLLSYSGMAVPGVCKEVNILTATLNQTELARYVNEVFEKWVEAGAEAKKKWVLYAAAIHGGSVIVPRLQHMINEWSECARGAIAAEAVKALSLNDSPTALLIVDGMARKYKHKQVRKAAKEALEFAAKELSLTVEELADRIVPDLGFDEHMERRFDYGSRSFIVTITPALEVEVFDEDGKKRKSMPAPGKTDDEAKAAAAYAEFKEMKKQMKTAVKNQAARLELAMAVDRRWKVDAWKQLFVKNPIMHQFAISLIWGYYEDNVLKQTFRYMEDGTFNTVEEEEFELGGGSDAGASDGRQEDTGKEAGESADRDADAGSKITIGLIHPINLTKEELAAWKEQLSDYEITQSILQLERPCFQMTEEEKKGKFSERFGGMILNGLSLSGKLTGLGWSKGPALDGGVYDVLYREDADIGLAAEVSFSGVYIGDENEDVTVYRIGFYKSGNAAAFCYAGDKEKEEKAIPLAEIPAVYFSEIIYQVTKATASSTEKDEFWKES